METQHGLPAVTCRDLRKLQDKDEKHVIIDVREEADYEAGHIEGSIHVPLRELETNIDGLVPDKNEYVIVVGEEKGLARETNDHLKAKGYGKVEFLLGGFDEWCKPAAPDISDIVEDAKLEAEIAETKPEEHEEEVDSENDNQPLL